MKQRNQAILFILALVLAVFTGACSSKPFLKVQYQLPPQSKELEGRIVYVSIKDKRNSDDFLGENAIKSFEEFSGTFSLVVLRMDGTGDLVGVYELVPLLKEIFKQRLAYIGVETTEDPNVTDAELEIELEVCSLDLVDRNWVIHMTYQANLIKGGKVFSMEKISGSAERSKVIGHSDAEKILAEILSDVVNKLDLVRLFQQARL